MDPEPPKPDFPLLLALLPALVAAAYATVTASMGSLSAARRAALKETLHGAPRAALERYLNAPDRIEARWLWLRVAGVAATAALLSARLDGSSLSWLFAWGGAILTYAIPSELARPFATTRAERWITSLLRALRPLEWIVAPLSDPLSLLAQRLAGSSTPQAADPALLETEVELIVNAGEQNGSLDRDQSEMIRNVLDFGDLTAEDVMVPRIHIDAIDITSAWDDVLRFIASTQHSRYPVYEDGVDNIVGVLHVKDLFSQWAESGKLERPLRELARSPVVFVPETQPASIVLKDMRAGRHHLAVVIDEFGGFSGIVTLEDLLEEIVGDIQDEHDLGDAARISWLEEGRALVDASLPVSDVNRQLNIELPEGEDYVSLGGLLVDQLGRLPPSGSQHELLGFVFTIREADKRRIARVEIAGLPATTPAPESGSSSTSGSSSSSSGSKSPSPNSSQSAA